VNAYNEFKDKNFTILGVSLDQSKAAWMQAIQQDGLTWTHVSDLKFWDNAAATLYGVQGIPYNVLVDPNGEIIAENLHGEEIVQTLRKVIK
jgi:alkyl hydroperoxide reductase subunit AhpC